MTGPLVYDLCGGSGAWSRPYAEAGYDVRLVDLPQDVRLLELPSEPVHGILAAPPCTYFCRMRMCRGRPTDEQFREGLSVVDACLRIIAMTRPKWWSLENPQGYLTRWLGQPKLKFHPYEYGDPWTKRTWLWGDFVVPWSFVTQPAGAWVKEHAGEHQRYLSAGSAADNARTPPGFARAFFEANP